MDLALWDLKGKRLGVGVTTLLGRPVCDAIPGYASFPRHGNAERLVAETARAMEDVRAPSVQYESGVRRPR